MIPVKRNSIEFKEIKLIFEDYETTSRRIKMIKLYTLKPFEAPDKKILIEGKNENERVAYSLTYDMILDYLAYNKTKKLFRDENWLYFFKNNSARSWLEFPFELSKTLMKRVEPLRIVR